MNLLFELNPSNASKDAIADMARRRAARGPIFNQAGLVCVMHATKPGYFKLPGGGIEGDEQPEAAFIRECLEEAGFMVEITKELGIVEEYRTDINRHQTSYCFVGTTVGEAQETNLDPGEAAAGFQPEWLEPPDAIKALESGSGHQNRFIVQRDLQILRAALDQAADSR